MALPILDEWDWFETTLNDIRDQNYQQFTLWICVNQPEDWRDLPEKQVVCGNNEKTLKFLKGRTDLPIRLIDRSSPGRGWPPGKGGVGWARKTIMDAIDENARSEDILVSLDADTRIPSNYFSAISEAFHSHPKALAIASPYYHHLPDDPVAARAILRYEIYMRHYQINLWRIESPYAFTALGSALACQIAAYRKTGGLSPRKSGEDFYFLQKLRKTGAVLAWLDATVNPAARFSDRVGFGTGPAMIRGARGDWASYPVYDTALFDLISDAVKWFPKMRNATPAHPVFDFLASQSGGLDPFEKIRRNHPESTHFIRACHEKLDGLRILQFLKYHQKELPGSDDARLASWLKQFYPDAELVQPASGAKISPSSESSSEFNLMEMPLESLNDLRDFLFEKEMKCRFRQGPLLPDWQPPQG